MTSARPPPLVGKIPHFFFSYFEPLPKEVISLVNILEFETKLVNNDETLVMSDSSGWGVYPGYKDLSRDTVGVKAPGFLLLYEAKLDLLGGVVILASGADCGPFFINDLQH